MDRCGLVTGFLISPLIWKMIPTVKRFLFIGRFLEISIQMTVLPFEIAGWIINLIKWLEEISGIGVGLQVSILTKNIWSAIL